MCFRAHSNRHLPYTEEAPVLYCCIVLLRQQEPARNFSDLRMPATGNVRVSVHRHLCGLLYSEPTWVRLSYIMRGPTSNHLHPQFSSYGVNQHSHIHIPAIFCIVMGKLRLHLSSIPGIENATQTLYATSTTSFKLAETPMATLRATFHGTCNKRALIIKGLITLPPDVSISVILTTEC